MLSPSRDGMAREGLLFATNDCCNKGCARQAEAASIDADDQISYAIAD
jgi:hypothetical protein